MPVIRTGHICELPLFQGGMIFRLMADVAQDSLKSDHNSSKGMAGMRLSQRYYQLTAGIVITCLIAASITAGMWLGDIPITGNII